MVTGISVFDADGTLTDTLSAHLRFCNDENEKYKLGIKKVDLLDIEACRAVVGTPMDNFLRAYGFPERVIPIIMKNYFKFFNQNPSYATSPFPGVEEMLRRLKKDQEHFLGIVSSNSIDNIKTALEEKLYGLFNSVTGFDYLKKFCDGDKTKALNRLIWHELDAVPSQFLICVGDTRKDYEAARASSTRFIWVNWGWEKPSSEGNFRIAKTREELTEMLISK